MNTTPFSRREFLKTGSNGFGYLAFAALAQQQALRANPQAATGPLAPKAPHFAPRAKHVIFLCMQGAPSHVDTFDYKPKLIADNGKSAPSVAGRYGTAKLMSSPWKFNRQGKSGLYISELFPNLGKHADEMCILNSMATDLPAHPQAFSQLHTGTTQFVRPSLGSWALYGLGTMNENLPGFITVNPPGNATRTYGSAFLPAIYQGTKIGGNSLPGGGAAGRRFGGMDQQATVANIKNDRYTTAEQRTQLDLVQALNRSRMQQDGGVSAEVEGVIESYELAFRMQAEVPKVMDLSKETAATKALYGIDEQETDAFGRQCLMARKFVEAGVRFIELTNGNWDQHFNLKVSLERNTGAIDKPIAGLLTDLKQRGLLKDTLIIWGGEFGRTPHSQGEDGRDHNNKGFSMWMAGGGVKGGMNYGMTDDYGYEAVQNKMHIHDWHATVLALLGLDHERLTFRYAGRDFRLTDVYGTVAKEIMA
ncbi:MAG: sulfatase [Verrucomicrobia bacterium 12-59-8]|nr:MAG: sulfatase [Verrucomicrobia bacterium 12-59-8]